MSIKIKNFFLSRFHYTLIFFLLYLLIKQVKNECGRETPILKGGSCYSLYCTEEEFKNEICKIGNGKIRIQWLNNIIRIGDKDFRYVNIAEYSNGDMVIETTSGSSSKRMFYGIKSDGRPFFNSLIFRNKTYFLSIESNEPNDYRVESELFVTKIVDDHLEVKEHLFSIAKGQNYAEIYKFNKKEIVKRGISELSEYQMGGLRGTILNLHRSNNDNYIDNYIVFGFTENNYVHLRSIYCLSNVYNSENQISIRVIRTNTYYNMDSFSCFVNSLNKILCISLCYYEYYSSVDNYGCIILLKDDLISFEHIKYINDIRTLTNSNSFIKAIHLKEKIGAFIYFKKYSTNDNNYPIILLIEYSSSLLHENTIRLNKYITSSTFSDNKIFNDHCLKNDLIKLSNNKLCYITTSNNNEILYIVVLNIINMADLKNIIIRYYSINISTLYNHKILYMRAHPYNQKFLSLAFSYSPQDTTIDYYSAFMIFGYPNNTDSKLNVIDYLFDNNNIKINSIIINLNEKAKIDNNLFGYVYRGFTIKDNGCNNIKLLKSDTEEVDINLEANNIILNFNNNYEKKDCLIKYAYIYKDTEFVDYNYYSDETDRTDSYSLTLADYDTHMKENNYEGKIIYYNIIIENDLDTVCGTNCKLCLKKNKYCITCKNDKFIIKKNKKKKFVLLII